MLFRILGPLRVRGDFEQCSPVRRAILTALLLRAGQPMGIAQLAELLWDEPPVSAVANIRSHITGLRRDLERAAAGLSSRIRTHRGNQSGYMLDAAPEEVDLPTFLTYSRQGRKLLAQGEADRAIETLEEAVTLWRGPFGQDLPPTRWFDAHTAGLNKARLDTYQDLFTARILAGRTEMLSYQIESLIAEAAYQQRLWELLAAVHCIEGNAADALAVIKRCQKVFVEDLGLNLPPDVEAMRAAALSWDRHHALRLIAARTRMLSVSPG
ncbi:AfsR/SARP family transcriptional regulator [Streptomyces djakartensis]|jgi:DNA-binding SARP family transcriptional activator|uniref:AfsR/SARP family transcriptional regulator n=1 Tax=Streptomyces djakartensis TaxID=68193 RepID=UPI0034DE1513